MEEAAPKQEVPKSTKKLLRLLRTVIVGAVIAYGFSKILDATGLDSWDTFSQRADTLAQSIMVGATRMSPVRLWKSIFPDQISENSPAAYEYRNTDRLSVKDKILAWLGYYWFTDSSKPFWVGRILLILGLLMGIRLAVEDHRNAINKTSATLLFPFNALFKCLMILLMIGVLCILIYFIIYLFRSLGSAWVGLTTSLHLSGGLAYYVVMEIQEQAAGSMKDKFGSFLFPFLYKKKKKEGVKANADL